MAGLKTNVGEEVLYISFKWVKRKVGTMSLIMYMPEVCSQIEKIYMFFICFLLKIVFIYQLLWSAHPDHLFDTIICNQILRRISMNIEYFLNSDCHSRYSPEFEGQLKGGTCSVFLSR